MLGLGDIVSNVCSHHCTHRYILLYFNIIIIIIIALTISNAPLHEIDYKGATCPDLTSQWNRNVFSAVLKALTVSIARISAGR